MNIIEWLEIAFLLILLVVVIKYSLTKPSGIPPEWRKKYQSGKLDKNIIRVYRKHHDKTRFYYFWFQLERIKKENIEGDLAELGVYKGHSAKLIHSLIPDRPLHLFDTFKGFPESDLENETGKAATYTAKNFADCSIQGVKDYLGDLRNIVFHPGEFTGVIKEKTSEKYAFINIDADLYNPTIAGLRYFYQHLSEGGVIFVHDYNSDWPGIIKAVNEFSEEIPEIPVQLADKDSSVLIIKNKINHSL